MILGFHHVTAISADPQKTVDFYTGFFGLRLVKKTVNFDDPGTYHLYFGNGTGDPGTLLTIFPWRVQRSARIGAGQAIAVAFRAGDLTAWSRRAAEAGIEHEFGDESLALRTPCGLAIRLIEGGEAGLGPLHSVTVAEPDIGAMTELLTGVMGFDQTDSRRFEAGSARIDLEEPVAERGRIGPGAVHHVAFQVASIEEQDEWRERLIRAGERVTIPQDRRYFRSIYFRPHRSVLFEIATSAPGFTVDEPLATLGESLCLPPWLESERSYIESRLPPV